ncbi:MAG: hypothetical protein ACK5DM_24615, partial [Planctomyces sp.]
GWRFLGTLDVAWDGGDLQVLRGAEMGLGDRGAGRTAVQVVAFLSSDWWRSLWRRAEVRGVLAEGECDAWCSGLFTAGVAGGRCWCSGGGGHGDRAGGGGRRRSQ